MPRILSVSINDDFSSMNEVLHLSHFKRSSELYLRALWATGFTLQEIEEDEEPLCYLQDNTIHLPGVIRPGDEHLLYYRAAATHAAAHRIYGGEAFDRGKRNLMQRTVIGLVEDLRVELLAINQFPGLRKLWMGFHDCADESISAGKLLRRLSRSVLDPKYQDTHQWVKKGRELVLNNMGDMTDGQLSVEVGLMLANDLGQMRLPLNSGRYEQLVLYRDDNRCLWQEERDMAEQSHAVDDVNESIMQQNSFREQNHGMRLKLSDVASNDGESFRINQQDDSILEYKAVQQLKTESSFHYPEWDYRSHVLKKNWCTVIEKSSDEGSIEKVEEIFEEHKIVLRRLRFIARKLLADRKQRVRKIEHGDEIDLDPVVNSMVDIRRNIMPDMRVFMRNDYRHEKNLAMSILLDLSKSTNEIVAGSNISVTQLMRDAVLLLGETLSIAEEQFAISGFSSNGRHQVDMIKFKSFDESFEDIRPHLGNIKGEHSTRLGAAIRHAGQQLARQPAMKKLLLVITDGAPSDIDVYDSQYLEYDSKHAVNSLKKDNIKTFCLNLDGRADRLTEHIFGNGRYETLDNIIRLPEVLSYLYIRHMRH